MMDMAIFINPLTPLQNGVHLSAFTMDPDFRRDERGVG